MASNFGWDKSSVKGSPGYSPNLNNYTCFGALPGGTRSEYGGPFNYIENNFIGQCSAFWTTTSDAIQASCIDNFSVIINNNLSTVRVYGATQFGNGLSCRCTKD